MKKYLVFSFSLIGQIGLSVAIPLVVLGLFGRFLDRKFDTSPYLFVSGLVIATFIVYFTLKKIVRDALKGFEDINK